MRIQKATESTRKVHQKATEKANIDMANVTEMPPLEPAEAEELTPDTSEPTTSAPKPAPKKTGRPRKGEEPDPETRARQFFDRAAQIPREDWGNRAWMYLYIDEPICDEKQWGKMKYAKKLHQPIFDLEKVKDWYGSCKGWISLNLRKPDAQNTDQIGRHEFEIFDIHCPPKIPKACWTDDPANKKWAALLPPEQKPQTEGATSLLDSIKVYKEIVSDVKGEMEPLAEPANNTRETLETMKLAKELFAPPAEKSDAKPADPLALATELAKTFMQMKSDNPMVDFLKEQMQRQHEEMMAMRKEMAEREKKPDIAPAPKGLLEQLMDFGGEAIKTRIVSSIFGGTPAGDAAAPVARAGRMNTLEFISDFGPKALQTFAPLIDAAAHKIMNPPANGAPANGNTPPPLQQQSVRASDPFGKFIVEIVNPKMLMYFNADPSEDGGQTFADWIYAGFPEFFERLQNFEHPGLPGLKGATAILTGYKNTPHIWQQIGAGREAQFAEFVQGFCGWKPSKDDGDENIQDAEIVNTEMEEGYEEQERVS